MRKYSKAFYENIINSNRYLKRFIILMLDAFLCIFCTWLAFTLRFEQFVLLKDINLYSVGISIIISLPIFWMFGFYRAILQYTNFSMIITIFISTSFYGFIFFLIIGVYGIQGVPRSLGIIQPMLLFFSIVASRLSIKFLLLNSVNLKKK
jgi:FlaA1/EpsC-like NDP-sugar epimerase